MPAHFTQLAHCGQPQHIVYRRNSQTLPFASTVGRSKASHIHPTSSCSNGFGWQCNHVLQSCDRTRSTVTRSSSSSNSGAVATAAADVASLKSQLYAAVEGIDRGIFGARSDKRQEVHAIVEQIEALNPTPTPTANLQQVAGRWKLVYSTISITGAKKTKLGLRDFIKLGDLFQIIDVENKLAVNEVTFSVTGLGTFSGDFRIEANYDVVSPSRVDVKFQSALLQPTALQKLFEKNYQLLLAIFNPEGWLEITYVDENFRVGRDDKENIFVLERA